MALKAVPVPGSPGLFKLEAFSVTSIVTVHGQPTLQTFDEPALIQSIGSITDTITGSGGAISSAGPISASTADGGITTIGSDPSLLTAGGMWIGVAADARTTLNANVIYNKLGAENDLFLSSPKIAGDTCAVELLVLGTTSFVRGEYNEPANVTKLGFFAEVPQPRANVTGALSAVADPAAKAVLTSLIAALKPNTGVGIVGDATT